MSTPDSPGPRRWILVVDDDARLRGLWIESLTAAGFAAVGSEDGIAALELIRDLYPDLIMLDLRMPRMSGTTFLDTIRGHPRWRTIPILIVSAYLGEEGDVVSTGLNIVGRIEKPARLGELIERVRAAVGPPGGAPRPA
ncbi:MAG: response regulator [Candidatus Rokuibacteriota bacterium]